MVHSDAKSVSIPGGDLSALIARLEAAEAGSRELDAEIWAALRSEKIKITGIAQPYGDNSGATQVLFTLPPKRTESATQKRGDFQHAEPATTSIDAALALAERMLPGWRKFVEVVGDGRGSACVFLAHEAIDRPWFHAPTPALALCIAILRAIPNGYEAAGEVSPNLKAKAQGEGG